MASLEKPEPLSFSFRFKEMQVMKDGVLQQMVVSELVGKGETLISAVDNDIELAKVIVTSDNCELSASSGSVIATVSGYPRWIYDESDRCCISVEPILDISQDKMVVNMRLYPALDSENNLYDDLVEILDEQGIRFGVNATAIKEAISQTEQGDKQVVSFVAANGIPVEHGNDASVKVYIELEAVSGELQKDGSLNFKERRMFVYVDEGQMIAKVIPLTQGKAGKNVYGHLIEPRVGKDVTIRVTEDAIYDAKRMVVMAGKSGVVSVVNNTTFKVSSKQTISGDIDYNTGNIYAKNNVEITGSIKPDFIVAVRGDIRIGRNIMSASVSSHGNLVVAGGVLGEKSHINVRGDCDISFIEKGQVYAGGNVILRKNSYYSTLETAGDLLGGDTSILVGGKTICGGNLRVGSIGSESADAAFIAVGTDVKRMKEFDELHRRTAAIEEEIMLLRQRLGSRVSKSDKIASLEEEQIKIRTRLGKLNLISNSPEDSLTEAKYSECKADLIVTGEISAGTVLRLGNLKMIIEKNLKAQRFYVNQMFKTIVAEPL